MKSRLFFRSWWRYQSYQNNARRKSLKTPPPSYIGTQVSLLADPDYLALSAHQRGQLHGMLLLAATDAGHIPNDPQVIATCLRLEHCDDPTVFGEWFESCEGHCTHNPEGFDSKGFRVSTAWARRGHGVGTASEYDLDKVKGKEKVKGKRSTASSKAPISSAEPDAPPGDDDAQQPPGLDLEDPVQTTPVDPNGDPEDPIGQVLAFLHEAAGIEETDRDRARAKKLIGKGYTVQHITGGITLGLHRAEVAGSKPESLAYFAGVIEEVFQAGGGYGGHLSRLHGMSHVADGMEKPR